MRQAAETRKISCEKIVKDFKRATRKYYSFAEKIWIVLDGLRGEDSIAELCRVANGHGSKSPLQVPEVRGGKGLTAPRVRHADRKGRAEKRSRGDAAVKGWV
jgi:hypothetical protein